jgi:hypothetical protein
LNFQSIRAPIRVNYSLIQGWQRAERAEQDVFPLVAHEQRNILLAHEPSRAKPRAHPARSWGAEVARSARRICVIIRIVVD